MVEYFTYDLINSLIYFQIVILVFIISNIIIIHRARGHTTTNIFPMVSILVPARNEERNIAHCVQSLLALDYPSFEVLVLDDQSSDNTRPILEKISASNPHLKVLEGEPPPGNQVGKNWACSQLARQAQGDLFFFTDADTFHKPETLKTIVTALIGERADLLTGFPHQEVKTWGERLLVPFFNWALYCFIPLILAYRFRLPLLSGSIGQMMLFRREAYLAVGGHDGVSFSIVDDLMLTRQIKAAGLRWRVVYITDLISCRMYQNYREAYKGFVKNLFAAFDFRLLPYVFVFIWLGIMFWLPLIVLMLTIIGQAPQAQLNALIVCITLSVLLWLIPYSDMGIPFGLVFLYPATILAFEWIALQSLRHNIMGRLSWKERRLPRSRIKWL
jgi:chlorobactene glucosyltransferase